MKSYAGCALHYYFQWITRDRELVERFKKTIRPDDVDKVFRFYGVSRNVPDKKRQGTQRYRKLATILNRLKKRKITKEKVSEAVGRVSGIYGPRTLSAASKAVWMLKQSPVIIYDSRALRALNEMNNKKKQNPGDYEGFSSAWREVFRREQAQIRRGAASVVRTLHRMLPAETVKLLGGKKTHSCNHW